MRLSRHSKIEITILLALALGSCGMPKTASQAYDLADDANASADDALAKIEELESRIDDLEVQTRTNKENIDIAFSNADADRDTANRNAQIVNRALDRLENVERRLRGY